MDGHSASAVAPPNEEPLMSSLESTRHGDAGGTPPDDSHAVLATFRLKDAGAVLTLSAASVRVTAAALRPFSAFSPIQLPPGLAQSPFNLGSPTAQRTGGHATPLPAGTALLCVVPELLGAVVDNKNKSLLSIIVCHEEAIPCVPAHAPQVTHTHLLRRQTVEAVSPAEALAACDALRALARVSTRRILVVVNPHSGDGSANSTARSQVVPLLRSAGISVDVRLTRYSLHAHAMGLALALSNGLTTDGALVDAALRHAQAAAMTPVGAVSTAAASSATARSTSPTRPRPASPGAPVVEEAPAIHSLSPIGGVPLVATPDDPHASCCTNVNAWCAARISALITTLLDSSDPFPLPPAFPVDARTAATGYPAAKLCSVPYDGCVVVGGDGTVHELVSGMLEGMRTRGRTTSGATPPAAAAGASAATAVPLAPPAGMADRFHVNAFMPIAALPCGTSNALSLGMGTAGTVSACFAVIKRRLRPLDGIEVSNLDGVTRVALCGVGWGIAGAIAADSEAWRPLGRARYAFLKAKHGAAAGLGLVTYQATFSHSLDTRYRRLHGLAGSHGLHNYGSPATVTQEALVALPAVEAPADGLVPLSGSSSGISDRAESSTDSPTAVDPASSAAAARQHPIVLPAQTAAQVLRNVSTRGRERELAAADVAITIPSVPALEVPAAPVVRAVVAAPPSTPHSSRRGRSRTGSAPFIDLEPCGRDCTHCVKYLLNPMDTAREVSARSSVPPSVETGAFVTVGIINTVPDARFCHASDGLLDVIIARKGEFIDTAGLMMRYIGSNMGVADERNSVLYSYVRARSAMLEPAGDSAAVVCNVDGEVFPGPAPFRFCVLPQYLVMFGL